MFNAIRIKRGARVSAFVIGLLSLPAHAKPVDSAFGPAYQQVAEVAANQAQVVYYRINNAAKTEPGSAHVYVDHEYHSGLLPGGYTAFCLAPGSHSLAAFVGDAPLYHGKQSELYKADLQGGKTYFIRINANNISEPVVRSTAEKELADSRTQVHTLSRASKVEACRYSTASNYKEYALPGDVLFAFGQSAVNNITQTGREAIQKLALELQRDQARLKRIQVIGHTDAIGNEAGNQMLGLKRAQSVRQLLMEAGLSVALLSASSAGSSDQVVEYCSGSRAEQVACNAPNRRVQVRVEVLRDAK